MIFYLNPLKSILKTLISIAFKCILIIKYNDNIINVFYIHTCMPNIYQTTHLGLAGLGINEAR